jgi:hypothetical protein
VADLTLDPRLPAILRTMRWRVRPERLTLVGIDSRELFVALRLLGALTGTFWQVSVEPGLVTLVLDESDWRDLRPAFPRAEVTRDYRAISFEVDLPPDLVGFMAVLSGALAEAQVPLLAVCTFHRDHLLVREADLTRAEEAIRALVARA